MDTICVVHADDEAAVAQLEQFATNSGARGLNGSHEGGAWLPQACERNTCKGILVAHQGIDCGAHDYMRGVHGA